MFHKFGKFKKIDVFVALYIFGVVAAALMGAKVMPLGSLFGLNFNISVALFLLPLMFTLTDAVNEIYGRKRAEQLVWLGVGVQILLVLFIWLATSLPHAARFEPLNDSYNAVFGISVRFAVASVMAFAVSGIFDVLIFSRLKKASKGKFVWLRSNVSNVASALIDTVVFMTVAYYGFFVEGFSANALWLAGLILPYWTAKCVMSAISTPLVYAGIRYLRKEKTDVSQSNQNVFSAGE
ncbi:queuosine precursor transporter [Candidatus Saccharibacteria bacterium]|nr:queuosine precursor transporter [Candidatus Saccharibacteria bacterium]MCL1963015.1 queuosine precursor transporter [Candidatus Saccharibacteria bacterium]